MPLDLQERDVIRRRIPQIYAAFAATLGGAAFGMVMGWSAPALEMLKAEATYTDEELSWVAGIPPLGSLVSMMLMALTLDRFGRKVVMLALVPPFVLGWLLLAFFRSIPLLLAGRFITGFCGAGYCTAAPVYTGEIAEKQIRGALGVFYQLMLTLGVLYVYVVGCWSDLKWLSLCCGIIPIVFFLLFCGAPESPVYLLENNHREDAIQALQWLRGPTGDIRSDLQDIEEMVEESHGNVGTLREMMSTKAALKGLWTQMGILFFQPLSGQNIIIFYAVSIFVAAGSSLDPNVASIIVASVQMQLAPLESMHDMSVARYAGGGDSVLCNTGGPRGTSDSAHLLVQRNGGVPHCSWNLLLHVGTE
ncbi:facilitated trehalose transporter Tret1-like isoform X2 [Schistocerca nitens]|uniref:facilitated trehalose transporter Tret1-like isoform X2 n=1 Tax=Schistocerca nitens TaxID=7011 RepID=UPI002117F0AC|nr:facilitated trehalose transporter Tret1-like isoform X2 [Schistocerca nitens]